MQTNQETLPAKSGGPVTANSDSDAQQTQIEVSGLDWRTGKIGGGKAALPIEAMIILGLIALVAIVAIVVTDLNHNKVTDSGAAGNVQHIEKVEPEVLPPPAIKNNKTATGRDEPRG